MNIEQKLKNIGLTASEIKIYLYLLETGIASTPKISKATKIARPNCYGIIEKLIDRKLVQSYPEGKRLVYGANDPVALERYEESRFQAIRELIPDLAFLSKSKDNKPKIKFLKGFDQVKEIWLMSLDSDHIRGITSTKELYRNSPSFFTHYHKKLKERKILLQDIITKDSTNGPTKKTIAEMGNLYETRILPAQYSTLPTDILIWDDNVALMNITDPVSATVITEKNMADTFRILFDLSWKQLTK